MFDRAGRLSAASNWSKSMTGTAPNLHDQSDLVIAHRTLAILEAVSMAAQGDEAHVIRSEKAWQMLDVAVQNLADIVEPIEARVRTRVESGEAGDDLMGAFHSATSLTEGAEAVCWNRLNQNGPLPSCVRHLVEDARERLGRVLDAIEAPAIHA